VRQSSPAFGKIRSDIAAIAWPPISDGNAAALAAMARQLDDSQWLPPETIAALQFRQLGLLAGHCVKYSPHFRRRLDAAGLKPQDLLSAAGLRRLPVLTRRDMQTARDLFCTQVPAGHSPVGETSTSGSTGEPVVVRRTAVGNFDWLALTLREHFWQDRDFTQRFCAIRGTIAECAQAPDWGAPVSMLFDTGPSLGIPVTLDIDRQLELIAEFGPAVLLVLPSTLAALARASVARGIALPALRHIRTIGETLSPETRAEVEATFPARLVDAYTSQEVGYIACECPAAPLYHVMETVIVEILDEDGAPCRASETGRVVITDLRNFATPMIRYDLGDYAQAGTACSCGRGLATLGRIFGRERNLLRLPDGRRHWPVMGSEHFRVRDIAPIRQYQVIQHDLDRLEVRLVSDTPVSPGQEDRLRALVGKTFGYPFKVDFTYFDGVLPRGANGKFEEFICRIKSP
jgi:phenylacetate-CoA ligase